MATITLVYPDVEHLKLYPKAIFKCYPSAVDYAQRNKKGTSHTLYEIQEVPTDYFSLKRSDLGDKKCESVSGMTYN